MFGSVLAQLKFPSTEMSLEMFELQQCSFLLSYYRLLAGGLVFVTVSLGSLDVSSKICYIFHLPECQISWHGDILVMDAV